MINRLTVIWMILLVIFIILGIFFNEIYGQEVIDIVIGLICLYFIYLFMDISRFLTIKYFKNRKG